jgi:dynein heavy chain
MMICCCCFFIPQALSNLEEFRNLDRDIEGSAKRWKKFVESECPEKEKFPQEWKNKTSLQKLCMMRALRPDRMTYAIRYRKAFALKIKHITCFRHRFCICICRLHC